MAHVSTAPHALAFTGFPASTKPRSPASTKQRTLFRRLLDALAESRRHRAEYEVARYLDSLGGKFTDEAEREIERRLMSSSNSSRW